MCVSALVQLCQCVQHTVKPSQRTKRKGLEEGDGDGGGSKRESEIKRRRKERAAAKGGATVERAEVCVSSEGSQLSHTIVGGEALRMTMGSLTPVRLAGGPRRREGVPICLSTSVLCSAALACFSSCVWIKGIYTEHEASAGASDTNFIYVSLLK